MSEEERSEIERRLDELTTAQAVHAERTTHQHGSIEGRLTKIEGRVERMFNLGITILLGLVLLGIETIIVQVLD